MNQSTKRGHSLDMESFASKVHLTEEGGKNIRGIEGSIFSETIKGSKQLEYLIFPKLLGLAERAWAPAIVSEGDSQEVWSAKIKGQWKVFANVLGQRELPRLSLEKVSYRIPPVGYTINNGELICNTTFPGCSIMLNMKDGSIIKYLLPIKVEVVKSVYSQDALGRKGKVSLVN